MKKDDMERWIQEAARDYNQPPAPPRDEMWAVIRGSLDRRSGEGASTDLARRRRDREHVLRLRRWTPWALGVAAAATLAVGFGLGRITGSSVTADVPRPATAAAPGETSLPLRLATADHLGEAEAMLTMFRSGEAVDDRLATAQWARDLLGTTRLLLDSRAGNDPQLAALLNELELVLVQIAHATTPNGPEQELIEEGIQERQLLTRLRTASMPPLDVAL